MTPHILVVDDQAFNRKVVARFLGTADFRLSEATSGTEAVQLFQALQPDLVLLDVLMDGIDGFETCRQIRMLPSGQDTPIVFLTALDDLALLDRAAEVGADDYLPKPINRVELLLRVKSLIRVQALMQERKQHVRELETANQSLRRMQEQKDELVALLVHDLKTPLASTQMHLKRLAKELPLSERVQSTAQEISQSVDEINRLILNLLDISLKEAGQLVPRNGPIEVLQLVREVKEAFRLWLEDRQQQLQVHLSETCHVIQGDRSLIKRLLENLLSNSIAYSPAGSTIRLEVDHSDTKMVNIRIKDQGFGVPETQRERIFDRHVRLKAHRNEHPGHGLGLTFCKMAAEIHGGRIWVDHNQPKGAIFCVSLPIGN